MTLVTYEIRCREEKNYFLFEMAQETVTYYY